MVADLPIHVIHSGGWAGINVGSSACITARVIGVAVQLVLSFRLVL